VLKKTIKYENFNGFECEEDFYFNYTTAELAEMAMSEQGGLEDKLNSIIASGNNKVILQTFRDIVKGAIGRRSEDGKRFVKDPAFAEEFMTSEPWSVMFMEMFTDPSAAAAFIRGVVPAKMADNPVVQERLREMGAVIELPEDDKPKALDDYTDDELMGLSTDAFRLLVDGYKGGNLPKRLIVIGMRRNNK